MHRTVAEPEIPGVVSVLLFIDVIDSQFRKAVGAVATQRFAFAAVCPDKRVVIICPGIPGSPVPDDRVVPVAADVIAKKPLADTGCFIVAVQSVRSIEGPRNRKILGMSTPELIALGV